MVIMYDVSDVEGYDIRTSELAVNAPLHMNPHESRQDTLHQ